MDMITLAMAKGYTEEKFSGCQSVVVDLDQYGIGLALLELFAQGGGTAETDNFRDFWQAVSVPNDLQLTMLYEGLVLNIPGPVRFFDGEQCVSVSFSYTAADGNGTVYTTSAALTFWGGGESALVTVKVF